MRDGVIYVYTPVVFSHWLRLCLDNVQTTGRGPRVTALYKSINNIIQINTDKINISGILTLLPIAELQVLDY